MKVFVGFMVGFLAGLFWMAFAVDRDDEIHEMMSDDGLD